MTVPAVADQPRELLARAHAAFQAGDLEPAAELAAAAHAAAPDAAARAEAAGDAAVIAFHAGELDRAREWAQRAVALAPADAGQLETLGRCCEAQGDRIAAAHWLRRAAELDVDRPDLWADVARLELARGRVPAARAALAMIDPSAAPGLAIEIEERERLLGEVLDAVGGEHAAPGRVLIVVEYFFPSVGGTELLAEAAGLTLRELGWEVEIATSPLKRRKRPVHQGLRINEVDLDDIEADLARIVARRGIDATLVFAAPTTWPHIVLALPEPRPRIVDVPCVNEHNTAVLHDDEFRLRGLQAFLRRADVVGYSSHAGWDARLLLELGQPGTYLPNAVKVAEPAGPFRARHGIDEDAPLLVAIGNLWPEKRHTELVQVLRDAPGDWRLCIIGHPVASHQLLRARLEAAMAHDPRVHLVPGATAPQIASALEEATALLLPSAAEATPLVLLEAMSHGVPWIATPTCGSADDHAGGIVLPLEAFPAGLEHLLADPRAAAALGAAGRADFEARYTWEALGARYARLLAGARPEAPLEAPAWAAAATDAARAACLDAAVLGAGR